MFDIVSPVIHRALQRAASAHRDQVRKGSSVPYISHPASVGFLLMRAGFDDDTVAAAILHDVVEDTMVTEAELAQEFGPLIAELVHWVSEQKRDANGQELPWEYRKQDKLEKLAQAPLGAKAIALADKLHNLFSTLEDERAGVPIWSRFKAPRERWLSNAARAVEACDGDDPRLKQLADACRSLLSQFPVS